MAAAVSEALIEQAHHTQSADHVAVAVVLAAHSSSPRGTRWHHHPYHQERRTAFQKEVVAMAWGVELEVRLRSSIAGHTAELRLLPVRSVAGGVQRQVEGVHHRIAAAVVVVDLLLLLHHHLGDRGAIAKRAELVLLVVAEEAEVHWRRELDCPCQTIGFLAYLVRRRLSLL
jgi:hypothetical protein